MSWTAHADLAEAAAILLTEQSVDRPTAALTGATALDLAGIAAVASEVTGRPIRRTVVSDAQYRDNLDAHGVPTSAAEMLVGLFAASRNREFAAVDPTLERLLDRPPLTIRDALTAHSSG